MPCLSAVCTRKHNLPKAGRFLQDGVFALGHWALGLACQRAKDHMRRELGPQRGAGRVQGDSALEQPADQSRSGVAGFDNVAGPPVTPELQTRCSASSSEAFRSWPTRNCKGSPWIAQPTIPWPRDHFANHQAKTGADSSNPRTGRREWVMMLLSTSRITLSPARRAGKRGLFPRYHQRAYFPISVAQFPGHSPTLETPSCPTMISS